MSANRVATRYARALVDVLVEKNAIGEAQSFTGFCDQVTGHSELQQFFGNVTIGSQEKAKVAEKLAEKAALPDSIRRFLTVLANNGRLSILADVKTAVSARVDAHLNVKVVQLTTPSEMSANELKLFGKSMEGLLGCQVKVDTKTDPNLLGGAIAQVGSLVYDGSVREQLNKLRVELVKEK